MLAPTSCFSDTTLQALRLCLEKSKGKPKLATLQTVLGYVVPMGRLAEASGSIDEEVASLVFVRRAASACVGAALASAASTSDTAFRDVSSLVPWCQASSDSPLVQQANAQALMVMLKLVPTALLQGHAEEFKSRTLRTVSDCCMSNDIGVRQAGLRALDFSLAASLEA
uniref:DUF4042 domain-containing protein n=1 Tax=Mesocestoides corti TaxID=53468 RepID=A0A5K3FCK7_MESCO